MIKKLNFSRLMKKLTSSGRNISLVLVASHYFRRSMGDLTRYDRDNPLIAIRQITTGFRKWADRYIAECHGQRVYK